MKKEMWKLMMGVAMVLFSFSMASCGDDDEVGSESDLIGTWSVIHAEGYEKRNGEVDEDFNQDFAEGKETIIFKENHTAVGTWLVDGEFQWKYKGNKLTLSFEDEGEIESEDLTVLELNSTRMVVEMYEKEKANGTTYESYMKLTCKKTGK